MNKFEIRFSETEGRSLIATERIRQGETIVELPTKTVPEPDMYSLEVVPGIHLDCYAHPIGATNHSCKANAAVKDFKLVAWECIKEGDEITIDYRKTETHLSNSFVCRCCGEKMEW